MTKTHAEHIKEQREVLMRFPATFMVSTNDQGVLVASAITLPVISWIMRNKKLVKEPVRFCSQIDDMHLLTCVTDHGILFARIGTTHGKRSIVADLDRIGMPWITLEDKHADSITKEEAAQ